MLAPGIGASYRVARKARIWRPQKSQLNFTVYTTGLVGFAC